ncbi:hypothetical protein KI387_015313, partial [Taxus chinensis]
MILDLFTRVIGIQEKYEVAPNPFVNTQAPYSGVKEMDKSEVSHGRNVNEHRPGKEKNQEYSSILNKKHPWGSDEMLNGKSAIWINMKGNWHYDTDFKELEGSEISKQGPKNQENHMDSLLP